VLSVVLLPLSLGVAVLSRQFLGIDRLVRRGLVSLLVWVGLLAVYAVVLWRAVDAVWSATTSRQFDGPLLLGSLTVVAATFWPLQGCLRRRLERWLFHDVYDFTATVHAFGAELAQLTTAAPIAQHALQRLGKTLGLSWAVIETLTPGHTYHWQRTPEASADELLPLLEVPLVAEGRPLGHMRLGPKQYDVELSVQDEALVVAVAPLIASALQSALLLSRLEEQVSLLADREQTLAALSGRLMHVQEEERRRLALELHDDPLQRATLLARRLAGRGLDEEQESAEDVAIALRAICYGLRPPMLDDLGLAAALDRLISDVAARSDVQVLLHLGGPAAAERVDPALELALYRVAQEGLNNVLKHAHARQASVSLERGPDWIELRIEDDGRGTSGDYRAPNSLGLVGIRERLLPWAGQVHIGPRPQGGGTLLLARVRV
jgi:signal transduction histidine kinase